MIRTDVKNITNNKTSDTLIKVLKSTPEVRIVCRLDEALQKRGITQQKLSLLTGLRPTTISEILNNSRYAITKAHLAVIMIALRITDIRELLNIEFSEETTEQFDKESAEWTQKGVIPQEIVKLYADNAVAEFKAGIKD